MPRPSTACSWWAVSGMAARRNRTPASGCCGTARPCMSRPSVPARRTATTRSHSSSGLVATIRSTTRSGSRPTTWSRRGWMATRWPRLPLPGGFGSSRRPSGRPPAGRRAGRWRFGFPGSPSSARSDDRRSAAHGASRSAAGSRAIRNGRPRPGSPTPCRPMARPPCTSSTRYGRSCLPPTPPRGPSASPACRPPRSTTCVGHQTRRPPTSWNQPFPRPA